MSGVFAFIGDIIVFGSTISTVVYGREAAPYAEGCGRNGEKWWTAD